MALPVERLIVWNRDLPAFGRGNAGLDTAFQEIGAQVIAVIAAVAKQFVCPR
jgi:hypothetical protein